jgi:hypothetical protein
VELHSRIGLHGVVLTWSKIGTNLSCAHGEARLCGLVVKVPGYRSRGFDSRLCQIFWQVVSLERGPLSLVKTTEELLGRKNSNSCLESREYGHKDPSRWPRVIFYPQNLALTSLTSGGHSVGRGLGPRSLFFLFCSSLSCGKGSCNLRDGTEENHEHFSN